MTLLKTKVQTYRIDKVCDKCKKGLLIATGTAMSETFHSYWEHICNECGATVTIRDERYPHEITEDIDKPIKIKEPPIDLQSIADEMNYHNMCARATLGDVPIITVEDLKGTSVTTGEQKPIHIKRNPNTI